MQFAATALAQGQERVLASAIIDEIALDDWPSIEQWLNVVSGIRRLSGVYVVVSRRVSGPYPYAWNLARLTNLLRLIHALKLNDLFVLCGFSDFEGLACQVAGADGFASGWAIGRRTFIESRWQPEQRGGPAVIRSFLPQVLSPLRVDTEITEIQREREAMHLLDAHNQELLRTASGLDRKAAEVLYLRELAGLSQTVTEDPQAFDRMAREALAILPELRQRAVIVAAIHENA